MNQETLLTLLEAFIYDPLVDWTVDRDDHVMRARMDLNVSLSLFSSRVDEIRGPLLDKIDRLVSCIMSMSTSLSSMLHLYSQCNGLTTTLNQLRGRYTEQLERMHSNTADLNAAATKLPALTE